MIATEELVRLLFKKRSEIDRFGSPYPVRDGYDVLYAWVALALEQKNERLFNMLDHVNEDEFITIWDNLIYEKETYSFEEQETFKRYISELFATYWRENKEDLQSPILRDCEEAYKYFRKNKKHEIVFLAV